MAKRIDTQARIEAVRLQDQGSAPAAPAAGYSLVFTKSNGLYLETSAGAVVGPFITGSVSNLSNSSIAPTTTNVTGTINTRHFADISGLTANRNFILPAGNIGNEIYINIVTGSSSYKLAIIGAAGVSINGGSPATIWGYMFASGENLYLVANTETNWQIIQEKRVSCVARYETNAGQSFPNNTGTAINFEDLSVDTDIAVIIGSSWAFTCPTGKDGNYRVSAAILWQSTTTWVATEAASLLLYKNGSLYSVLDRKDHYTNANQLMQLSGSDIVALAGGDTLQIWLAQASGGTLALYNDADYNYVCIEQLK